MLRQTEIELTLATVARKKETECTCMYMYVCVCVRVRGSNRFRNHTCRTDVILYFGGLLSSPVFSILRDDVMISFAKIEKNIV